MKASDNFLAAVEQSSKSSQIKAALAKVNKLLRRFMHFRRRKEITDLLVVDVINVDGRIQPALVGFVNSHYSNVSTRTSQISVLNRVIRLLGASSANDTEDGTAPPLNGGKQWEGVWLALGRIRGRGKVAVGDKSASRAALPLTEIANELWRIFVTTIEEFDPKSAEELLVKHYDAIKSCINNTAKHQHRTALFNCFSRVRGKMGLALPEGKRSLMIEDLPPKMRLQLEMFLKRAPLGFGAYPHLRSEAAKFGITEERLAPLSAKTISSYTTQLLRGMAFITYEGDIGVEDLLRLYPITHIDAGKEVHSLSNPFTDQYRHVTQSTDSDRKRAGFDSVSFSHFVSAIKSIAQFNNIFNLQQPFNTAYRLRLDKTVKRARKAKKKEVMSRPWLFGEIRRLKDEFNHILKTGSYKNNSEDLDLVLFLPVLVTLTFLGYRQQCIRNCYIGKHITFNPKGYPHGSIAFTWTANEIKNKRSIETILVPADCTEIPELKILLDVLHKYNNIVLPYLNKIGSISLQRNAGSAFFICRGRHNMIRRFADYDETYFGEVFKRIAYTFLNFDDFCSENVTFNPHFLRGICCDWMFKDLGLSWAAIAEALGDSEQTLRQEYYGDDKKQSATRPFADLNKKRKSERREIERDEASGKLSDTAMLTFGNQIQMLTVEMKSLRQDLVHERERSAKLESVNALKDEQLASLMAQMLNLGQSQMPVAARVPS